MSVWHIFHSLWRVLKESQPQKKLFDSEAFSADTPRCFIWWLVCVAVLADRLSGIVGPSTISLHCPEIWDWNIFPLQSKSCWKSHQPRPSLLNTQCIYCTWRYQCYSDWGEGSPGRAGSEHDLCCKNNTAEEEYDLWRETAVCKYSPLKFNLRLSEKAWDPLP